MNSKLLLVNAITLLYRESQISNSSENSSGLVREIIKNIKLPGVEYGVSRERDVIDGLKTTALSMCEDPVDHEYESSELLQRLKINTADDTDCYQAIHDGIAPELTSNAVKRTCINLRRTLNNYFREEKVKEIIGKAAFKIKFDRSAITDMKTFVSELAAELEPYQQDVITKDPAIVSDIDLQDKESVKGVYNNIKEQEDGTTILKTGYQGINAMTDGGLRRGEQVVIGALQHKYKTGFSLSLFKQIAIYNVPQMIDPTKKPLLVRFSFEDDIALNFQFLYQSLKENETLEPVDVSKVDINEITEYVQNRLQETGYHVKLLRVDPTMWTYKHICNKLLEYESEGYEVHLCMLDYLAMVPTTGCTQGPMGTDLRDMYRRMRNFCNPRKITLVTPHQLSTEAKRLIRDGRTDFVREIEGKGYYAGCAQLDQEVDLEIYIHIEIVNGKSFLTVQRGKHRKIGQTPIENRYCVLPFHDVGGIRDDFGKANSTLRKVGGGPVGSGEEVPFWDFL